MHSTLLAILGWTAALVIAALCVGLGRFVAGLLRAGDRPSHGHETGLGVAFVAGAWVLQLFWMVLSEVPGLHATSVLVGTALLVPGAVLGWRRGAPRAEPDQPLAAALRQLLRPPLWLCAVLLLAWFAPYLIQTLLPDTDWDAVMYHRPLAMRILREGVTTVDPYRAQVNFPGAVPVFYAGFLALDLRAAMTPFNMIATLMTAVTALEIGRQFLSLRAGLWAAALVLTTNLVMELGVDQRNDGFLALFFITAMHSCLALWREPKRLGLLPLLGMSMGMALGTKLTGLLAVGMFGGVGILALLRARPPRFLRWLLLGIVCVAVPGGFWMARNAVLLGDPIYPFGGGGLVYEATDGELRSFYPDFEKLYATAEKPPDRFLSTAGRADRKEAANIFNLVEVFLHPEYYQNKPLHWLQPLLFLAFALPFFDRRPIGLWLCAFGCVGFLALGVQAHLVRYALPAYPLLAVGAAAVITSDRGRRIRFLQAILLVTVLGIGTHNSVREWIKVTALAPLDYLAQRESEYAWKVRRGYNGDPTSSIVAHRVNQLVATEEMSTKDTILMVFEGKVELYLCGAIPDVSAEAYLWLTELLKAGADYGRLAEQLRRIHVTHILINRQHIAWALTYLKLDSELQRIDYLRFAVFHALRFVQDHATEVFSEQQVELYRLK